MANIPRPSLRFVHVWRRNRLVWRKLAIPSMLGNLADPMLYMLGLGYGLSPRSAACHTSLFSQQAPCARAR
jgi:hypothetical protein